MSDYQGRLKLTLEGLDKLRQLDDRLESIESRADSVRQAIAGIGDALKTNLNRQNVAARDVLDTRQQRILASGQIRSTRQRRDLQGRYMSGGPGPRERKAARDSRKAAGIEAENALLELNQSLEERRYIIERGKRLRQRTLPSLVLGQDRVAAKRRDRLASVTESASGVNQELRLGGIDAQYQRRLQAFRRGGGGTNAPELIQKVFEITQAYSAQKRIISATGDTTTRVTRKQAAELGALSATLVKYNEAQLERNRLARGRVEKASAARRLGDRLRPLEAASGTARDPKTGELLYPNVTRPAFPRKQVERARELVNRAADAAQSGDQELFRLASFQAKKIIDRLEAGAKAGLKGAPSSPVRGSVNIAGSPAYRDRLARLGGPRESVRGRKDLPGSPAYVEAQRKQQAQQLQRAISAGGPRESIVGRKNLPGSPAYLEEQQRKRNRIAGMRQIASPIRGTAAMVGSPAYLEDQQRRLSRAVRMGGPKEDISGRKDLVGSPAYYEEQRRQLQRAISQGGPKESVRGRKDLPGSPAYYEEQRKQQAQQLQKAIGTGGPRESVRGRKDLPGSPAYVEAQRKEADRVARLQARDSERALREQQAERNRIARLRQIASPIRGTATMVGSPAYLDAQARAQKAGQPVRSRGPASPIGGTKTMVGSPAYLAEQKRQQGQRAFFQGDARSAIGDALIGGAFPALFGQGFGASAGGALGGGLGGALGGSFGFGLSLVGTAVGQAIDTTAKNLTDLASALKTPGDTMEALAKSGFHVSNSLKFQVQQLESVGRAYDAQTLVLQEVEKRLGPGSVRQLNALESEQRRLQEQWSSIAGTLQSELLPALVGFTGVMADTINVARGINTLPGAKQIGSALRGQGIGGAILTAANPLGGATALFDKLQRRGKAVAAGAAGNRQAAKPQDEFAAGTAQIQESRKIADQIQSAYREAFSLQRQAYDLQRDGAKLNKDIADYSYKKEREIFDLRQQAAEKQIENNRARAQNRIEGSDLNARQTFAAAVGFEQQLLTNVREVVRSRKEGEADIEQSRNRLELAMAKLNRDVEDYKRTNAREIEDIEQRKLSYVRSVEDYKMKVADHVLQRAREAADLMRQAMTLPDMGTAAAPGAPRAAAGSMTGRVPRTLMGTPGVVEYLTGDRSSPGYRADHGGSNYHEHIAFASRKIRDNVIAMLQRNGIQIGSTDGGSHAAGSYHYSGQAVDIPASQVPVGKEDALAKRVRALVAAYLGGSAGSSAQGQTATQISNIPGPKFSPVPIGPTPSIAPVNAANLAANLQLKGGTREAQQILEEQNKLRQKGIELGQIEQILQASQLPQLRQQSDTLKQQIEARQKILDLSDSAASVADIEAESRARITQLELDRSNALAKIKKQYGDDPALTGMVNKRADLAVGVAKNEEKQRRINLDLNNKLQNQERARSAILQLQETLATGKAEAAALERGKLQASNVELLKASELYQLASEAEKAKLALLTAQTEELGKQNEFRKRINEIRNEARFTGAGLRAGLIGAPARAFEEEMKRSGNIDRATGLANETKLLENQQLVWGNLEKNIVATSDAISGALTNGLASIADGSREIGDIGRDMLRAISGSFADSAQQQLTTLLQRQMGGLFQAIASQGLLSGLGGAGAGGLGGGLGAALSGSLGNIGSAFSAPTFGGFMAKGGITKPGEVYVTGEKEPEFFFPGVTGRVVPRSDMQKAEALRNSGNESDSLDISYTVREERGERYVTEDQLRKSNAMVERRAFAKTINGMKNNGALRDSINI